LGWAFFVHLFASAMALLAEVEGTMVDGLKLTLSGEEIRTLLEERINVHNESADHWRRERSRTPEEQTEDRPLLPDHMCEHETERHVWRAAVLAFIRAHIEASVTYRLGPADLEFGELLPAMPVSIEQDAYEERTALAFQLERLTRSVSEFAHRGARGHTVTRLDIEGGPEVVTIERTDEAES
jgi:hypothetical protein